MTQTLFRNLAVYDALDLEIDCADESEIGKLPRLEELSVRFIGDRDVAIASDLTWIGNALRLRSLKITNLLTHTHSEQIVRAVARCERLCHLTMGQLILTRQRLEQLAHLELETLIFEGCQIDEAAVGELFPEAVIC